MPDSALEPAAPEEAKEQLKPDRAILRQGVAIKAEIEK